MSLLIINKGIKWQIGDFPPKVHLKDTLCLTVHACHTRVSLVSLSMLHSGYPENILNSISSRSIVTTVGRRNLCRCSEMSFWSSIKQKVLGLLGALSGEVWVYKLYR